MRNGNINYTKPDSPDMPDNPIDWLLSSMMFARAIGFLLEENTGVIVDLKGDMLELFPHSGMNHTERIIVCNKREQVTVISADERTDLKEGDIVHLIDEKTLLN
jgi:hypothetical protein